ncbi:hypothetical protein C2G38_2256650 [Gigaspora rosea]|uniref:Uncharacterized protein n=1 Tax=Gigaspora rosea TaxID=44941 RepID=A0A397TV00_9GLOM|nr:hypothetical protein C2G38_2256650 [Gigaspora rosea]
MVPLADFTTNKKIFEVRENREKKFTDYLNLLISPIQYSSLKEENYSPFIKLIEKNFKENKHDIRNILYENPSMGAVMNWMWYCSKVYLSRSLFTLLGYPFYIGLKQSPTTYEIAKGNNVAYTMTGEEPDNLFSNIIELNDLDFKFKDKIRAKYICFYDDPNITSSWKEESEKMESEPYPITQIENKIDLEFLSDEACKFIWEKVEKVEKVEIMEKDDKDIQYWFLEE